MILSNDKSAHLCNTFKSFKKSFFKLDYKQQDDICDRDKKIPGSPKSSVFTISHHQHNYFRNYKPQSVLNDLTVVQYLNLIAVVVYILDVLTIGGAFFSLDFLICL